MSRKELIARLPAPELAAATNTQGPGRGGPVPRDLAGRVGAGALATRAQRFQAANAVIALCGNLDRVGLAVELGDAHTLAPERRKGR